MLEVTPTGTWQRSLTPLKVFYVWEFPTSNTAQHSACTGPLGLFAHPVVLVIGWWVLCKFHDICVSNTDCLWNESGVHSKHSFWRIRCLCSDSQVLQALLNDVYMWTNCIYCRLPVDIVGWTGCCSSQWRSWPFVTETVDLKNQSCVRFPFIWLCYLKIVKRGKQLFLFMQSTVNFTASCAAPLPVTPYSTGGSHTYLESCWFEWQPCCWLSCLWFSTVRVSNVTLLFMSSGYNA